MLPAILSLFKQDENKEHFKDVLDLELVNKTFTLTQNVPNAAAGGGKKGGKRGGMQGKNGQKGKGGGKKGKNGKGKKGKA